MHFLFDADFYNIVNQGSFELRLNLSDQAQIHTLIDDELRVTAYALWARL